ncbi:MAG TPA: DUF58 domain-containing protein [Thermoguttaceae bacterium]|nr:DUF58 domain-containing protein [Thermoguttaceae bacterium]
MVRFDLESLNELRCLSLSARRAGGGILAKPRTRLPAGGTELTGHRDYAPGDDYRSVDWNLAARHDELLVKQFQGEADCPTYVLLDCSRSMSLSRPSKLDVARRIVLALAYVALADSGQVSVLAFSDRIVARFGPIAQLARIAKLARFLQGLAARGERTDLAAVAEGFVRGYQRHGLAVVVSDLCDPRGFQGGLEVLRRRGYHPRVVQLCDPREGEPDTLGDTELVDVETGASWQVTMTEQHVARYRRLYAQFHDSVRSYCAGHGIACAQVPVDLPENRALLVAIGAAK